MAVTFVNLFQVPPDRDAAFMELWQRVNDQWASESAWQAAHDEGFHALVRDPAWKEFPPLPTLYEVVHENRAMEHAR